MCCNAVGLMLCALCLHAIRDAPRAERLIAHVPVRAIGWYRGEIRSVIRSAKNYRARTVLHHLLPDVVRECGSFPSAPVIPIPPSKPGLLRRGYGLARTLARMSGRPIHDVLDLRDVGTQRGRGARARAAGRQFEVRGAVPPCAVLIDDVVTSGATVSAAIAALEGRGCRVVGIVALALVPMR